MLLMPTDSDGTTLWEGDGFWMASSGTEGWDINPLEPGLAGLLVADAARRAFRLILSPSATHIFNTK